MKILTISETGYGAWFATLFWGSGHESSLYIHQEKYRNVLQGIAPPPLRNISKLSDFLKYDLVLFDMNSNGQAAESLIKAGVNVIGDCLIADKLEEDRAFGLQVMEECGIDVPSWKFFSSVDEAKKFVSETKKRYVIKPYDGEDCASTYVSIDAEDMLDYLDELRLNRNQNFILQEVVAGTEISTEAFFDGRNFYFINHTLEEKKFMSGGLGPNTGCSGNIVISFGNSHTRLFRDTLYRMKTWLQVNNYVGMIDINCIVDESRTWGLEFTTRLGYDASATQTIFFDDYAKFLYQITTGTASFIKVNPRVGFAASVRLSIPPYPFMSKKDIYEKNVPINGIEEKDIEHCFLYDVWSDNEDFKTIGFDGLIAAPFAFDESFDGAWDKAYTFAKRFHVPNLQYRNDMKSCTRKRYETLKQLGWFDTIDNTPIETSPTNGSVQESLS